jgi:3-oxoacyl-[acyl-carrier protein] reductase
MSKIIVITGGSRGIGKSIVEGFALRGDVVEFCYKSNIQKANEIVKSLAEKGFKINATQVDVGDFKASKKWIEAILKRHKVIDVVINSQELHEISH